MVLLAMRDLQGTWAAGVYEKVVKRCVKPILIDFFAHAHALLV